MTTVARTWAVKTAGVLFVLLGVASALFVAAFQFAPRAEAVQPGGLFLAMAIYAGLAAIFLTLGIGLWRLRRWARNLALQLIWVWLTAGIFTMIFTVFWMPEIIRHSMQAAGLADSAVGYAILAVEVIIAVAFVAIPGLLLALLFGAPAKAACDAAQNELDWTEKTSPLALSLCLILALWAVFLFPGLAAQNFYMPFFGMALTGLPGAIAAFCLAAVSAWCAFGAYQRKRWSWKLAILVHPLWTISSLLTIRAIGLQGMMQASSPNMPVAQLMQTLAMLEKIPMDWLLNGMSLAWIAYILLIRKTFDRG